MVKFQLILSGEKDPFYNMALDEILFTQYKETKIPVLRIYGWQPWGISIGYNQKAEKALFTERCIEENIPFVRRITGGSAIFHCEEITYSVVCSDQDISNTGGIENSYKIICSPLIKLYGKLGLKAGYAKEDRNFSSRKGKSNFCFSSWEQYDIVINGKKLGGNAQKRNKDIILQHGSIPFNIDFSKIRDLIREAGNNIELKSTSLNELLNDEMAYDDVQRLMIDSFKEAFGAEFSKEDISLYKEDVSRLMEEKYRNPVWNYRS